MKLYLSYPMSNASLTDLAAREEVRRKLAEYADLTVYDPEVCEPKGMSMTKIQEHDFKQMAEAEGLLVIWSEGSRTSGGLLAEVEWARRIFHIPTVIVRMDPGVAIQHWTQVSARHQIVNNVADAIDLLREMID